MTDIYKGIIPLKMNKDTTINIGEYVVQIFSAEKYLNLRRNKQSNTQSNVLNTYSEDSKTNYIFSIKKLGWANIDRFFFDPRTKKVDLVTSIENHSEFKTIYVSMIVNNLKMYLPGYQKLDKTFSFTHGDYENPSLPIGETVSILATAYKGDIPYYAIKTITIQEKQNVSFKLQKTTMDKLKLELEEKF